MCSNGSTTPIILNSNHSVGKQRAREIDLSPVPRLSIQEAKVDFLVVNAKPHQL